MPLLEELVLHLDQPSPRDGFVEFPGQLGVNIVVGWDISDALKAKYIPLEVLHGVEYRYIVRYIGGGEFNNRDYQLFNGYDYHLLNLPVNLRQWVVFESNLDGGVYPYHIHALTNLMIRSVGKALKELKKGGFCHGAVTERNIVFICDDAGKISSVKLMGVTNVGRHPHRSRWEEDFYNFGMVIERLLRPYGNFPEALDFIARFNGTHRRASYFKLAFMTNPNSIKRHLMFFAPERVLSFLIRVADWMDGFRWKSQDTINYTMTDDDHKLYNAILKINTVDWDHGLPDYIMQTLPYKDFNSSEGFLKFARNHHLHSAKDPEAFQSFFGVTPEGYYKVFRAQNLEFAMECFNAVEEFFKGDSGVVKPDFFDHFLILPVHLLPPLH